MILLSLVYLCLLCFICILVIFLLIFYIVFDFTGFDILYYANNKIIEFKKSESKRKEKRLKNKLLKEQEKKIQKYNRTKNVLSISALKFEYSEYVALVEKILNEVSEGKELKTNDLYLIKLDEYFKKKNANIYDTSGISYLLDSILEYPVVTVVDSYSQRKKKDFLCKLLEYKLTRECSSCNKDNLDMLNILK